MTTQHTLKYAGFDAGQEESISAILDLADSALTCTWVVTDRADSDVLMVNFDAAEGQAIFEFEKPNRPSHRFILAMENAPSEEMDHYWVLTKRSHAPPSLKELAKLLNDVGEVLRQETNLILAQNQEQPEAQAVEAVNIAAADVQVIAPEPQPEVKKVEAQKPEAVSKTVTEAVAIDTLSSLPKNTVALTRPLYPRNYFFGLLVQAKKDQACRVIKQSKLPNLYLFPSDNSYYFSGTGAELLTYCTAMPKFLEETIVTKQKLAKWLKSGQISNPQSLDSLLVYAIIEVSQGRLLEGHSAEQAFTLTQIPDFANLPLLANYQGIAEYLIGKTDNLYQTAETLHKPLSTLFEFYNVCWLLGYIAIESVAITTEVPVTIEENKSGKLSHFLKNFFTK